VPRLEAAVQSAHSTYLKRSRARLGRRIDLGRLSVITRLAVTTSLDGLGHRGAALRVAGFLLSPVLLRRGLARDRLGWLGLAAIIAG